jgi:hypothetical protein
VPARHKGLAVNQRRLTDQPVDVPSAELAKNVLLPYRRTVGGMAVQQLFRSVAADLFRAA